jgi:hypothetical protein
VRVTHEGEPHEEEPVADVKVGGGGRVVACTEAEYAEVPPLFTAATRKSYRSPPVRPVTDCDVELEAACENVIHTAVDASLY